MFNHEFYEFGFLTLFFQLNSKAHERRILAGYYGLNANISFTFQAVKNLYAHSTYLCFVNFLVTFRCI